MNSAPTIAQTISALGMPATVVPVARNRIAGVAESCGEKPPV